MSDFVVAVQCESMGTRCGINTYATRLVKYLNGLDGVSSKMFVEKYKNGKPDIICVQYEPGMLPPFKLQKLLDRYKSEPLVITAHHTINLAQFLPAIDGVILHDANQMEPSVLGNWSHAVIPHPSLVFPDKDKMELRKKYGLPLDKKIIGTMGFICGTGKILPLTVQYILEQLKEDEFLYLITSFWKGGDMGRLSEIMDVVAKSGKTNNFRIDTDFMTDESVLNEKMQCCDLLYAWNNIAKGSPGSQSGSAADMYGARRKLIVKDCPHYSFVGKQDKVIIGREQPKDFADDVIKTLRESNLDDVQDPSWLSWEEKVKDYYNYFLEICNL